MVPFMCWFAQIAECQGLKINFTEIHLENTASMCKKFLNKCSEGFMLPVILMGLILQAKEVLAG